MAQMGDMEQQPGMQPGAPEAQAEEPGEQQAELVIELKVMPDGSIDIERETGEQEAAEQNGGGEEAGDTNPIHVNSIDEALQVVRHLYEAAQSSPEEQTAKAKADQQAGYEGM